MTGILQMLLGGGQSVVSDQYFENVTLLLPGNGTNGAQNNTFIDSSTNAYSITRQGNTTQGSFSPFSRSDGSWSNFFASNSTAVNYLTTSSITLSGDFTIEGYVYWDGVGTSPNFFTVGDSSLSSGLEIYRSSGNWILFANNSTRITGAAAVIGQWTYIALTRSGSTVTMYINGVSQGTWTSSSTFSGTVKIGAEFYNSTYYSSMSGYISNFRINNTTAINTVPTSPLTAISGTVLLTCQSNRFIDNSASPLTITVNGTPSIQVFNPFNPSAAYSTSTVGGSGYFDGNGDYLTASGSGLNPSSTDYTVEFWIYPTAMSGTYVITEIGADLSASLQIVLTSSGIQFGRNNQAKTNAAITQNAWSYVACVKTGTTYYVYVNGTRTTSDTGSVSSSNDLYLAARTGGQFPFLGYLANYQISNTARYTNTTMTVPTALKTSDGNTQFLANFVNAGIYDAAAFSDFETVGNIQIDTSTSKWGGSSIGGANGSSYLISYNGANVGNFGNGDFTVEGWIKTNTSSGGPGVFTQATGGGAPSTSWGFFLGYASSTSIDFYLSNGSTYFANTGGGNVTDNAWHHIAFSRSGSSGRLFLDGTQVGSTLSLGSTSLANGTFPISLFSQGTSNIMPQGNLQDMRITRGIARYTANFTPPTAAFPLL